MNKSTIKYSCSEIKIFTFPTGLWLSWLFVMFPLGVMRDCVMLQFAATDRLVMTWDISHTQIMVKFSYIAALQGLNICPYK